MKAPMKLLFVALLISVSSKSVSAQESDPAPPSMVAAKVSPLAGIRLPGKAIRMSRKADVADMIRVVQPLLDKTGVNLDDAEFLVWEGADYRRAKAEKLMAQTGAALQAAGYSYQQVQPMILGEGALIFMAAQHPRLQGLGGFWMVNDEFLSLTWGHVRPGGAAANPGSGAAEREQAEITGDESDATGGDESGSGISEGARQTPVVWGAKEISVPIKPITIGRPIAGALHGIYLGTQRQGYAFRGPIFSERGLGSDFITFYRDGRVLDSWVAEGMDVYDPDAQTGAFPARGRYRVNGNRVSITWSDGQTASGIVDAKGIFSAKGAYTDNTYVPLPVLNDTKLEGTFHHKATQYVKGFSISFTKSGRFNDSGILSQTGLTGVMKYSWLHWSTDPPRGTGNYRIRNNTLYLNYDSGIRLSVQILIEPSEAGGQRLSHIVLGGFKFPRQ